MFLSHHISEDTHSKELWLLDSGCSNHMTGNKFFISYLDNSIPSKITLEGHSYIKVGEKGIVPARTKQNHINAYLMFIMFHI